MHSKFTPDHYEAGFEVPNTIYIPFIIVIGALAGWLVYFPITDSDIWWHLAAGREMIAKRSFLYSDPFSFTSAYACWIDLHWLFQLLSYAVFSIAGEAGLVIVKCLACSAVCIGIGLISPSRQAALSTMAVSAILLSEARYLICERPILITMFCIIAYLYTFEKFRQRHNSKRLWSLIPIQIIWTNSQGLFILGLVITAAYWAETLINSIATKRNEPIEKPSHLPPLRAISILMIVLAASCLINPYGIEALTFPFNLFQRILPVGTNIYSSNVSENISFLFLAKTDIRLAIVTLTITALLLTGFMVNTGSIRIAHLLLVALFSGLAFMAERNILPYFIIAAMVLGFAIFDFHSKASCVKHFPFSAITAKVLLPLMFAVLLTFESLTQIEYVANFPKHEWVSPFRFPDQAVNFIKSHDLQGAIFNDIRYGGYLLWTMPQNEVFIDGRLIIRSPGFFAEYLTILDHPELFPDVARKFNITQVLLPTAIFYRSMKLIRWLYESEDWKCVFCDGSSMLFVRSDNTSVSAVNLSSSCVVDSIRQSLRTRWSQNAEIYDEASYHLSNLLRFLEIELTAKTPFPVTEPEESIKSTGSNITITSISGIRSPEISSSFHVPL